ncbi:MAG: N-6 DNA methylase [Nitrospirae bacterium]|nr:N-6 DNA methylase [Nitrospirota bacterium]
MADIRTNEREFTSQVISWLNEFIKDGDYPFEAASSEPSIKVTEKKTRFPDIQIWLNRAAGQGFCGWELKTPATPVDDQALLENAAEKARAMGADYFVTWNMADAVIWRTPLYPEKVSRQHRYKTYSPLSPITSPDDLWVESKRVLLRARAKEILCDLSTLHRDGHLHLIDVDSTYFVFELSEAIKTLRPLLHEALMAEVGRDTTFKNELHDWAVKQGIARYDVEEFLETVSRQIIYRLFGKIIFYLTLRRFRSDIPVFDLHLDEPKEIDASLRKYFEFARQIDYQAVFEEDFPDKVPFPQGGVGTLVSLAANLNRYNFSRMPQDVVGNVFEKLIPPQERHTLGQYFTNEELVDFITAFCVRSVSDRVLDPTCGTGTFLIRAYDRLRNAGEKDHKKLLSQIWGVDIARFPAELATINLYRQRIEDYANFPRVISRDFFTVKAGDVFKFPPPKAAGFMIDETIPPFDAIVGNFPYIRQELIEKRIRGYKDTLVEIMFKDWKTDYPELFNNGGLRLSGQADIYAYLFFHTARHLKEGGRMGIVTSNAWLDVAYGYELQRFFLKNFKIVAIIESRCESWFEDAAVNTIVTILERCSSEDKRNDNNVKFVKIKKRLKDLIPWDINLPKKRWFELDRLIHSIERAGSEHIKTTGSGLVNTLSGHATYDDENFRVRVLRQGHLLDKVMESGKTVKWGQYLRAPEIYFEILHMCRDKLVVLDDVAEINFGIKTGINEFFHLKEEKIQHWGIEKEFILPLITSPKEIASLEVDNKNIEFSVLYCNISKKDLRKANKMGILSYIKWGEKQYTKGGRGHKKEGIPFPEVPSVQGRPYWYAIGERKPGHFVINRFVSERFYFPLNTAQSLVGDVAFEGLFYNTNKAAINAALLNSSITFLGVELAGRLNLGDGLLTFYGPDIKSLLIPIAEKIAKKHVDRILKAFEKLLTRPIRTIFEEIKMKDRHALDSAVLEALGLEPKTYLKPLYEGLTGMVRERIELAKSRKKIKQARIKRDVERLKEQVAEEIIPDGVKRFPEDFVDLQDLKGAKEISSPNDPLRLGSYFMGQQEVVSDSGFKYPASSLSEAKFIVYAQRPNSFLIRIPKSETAIIKAVDDYERYLKGLKAELYGAFFNRVHDHKQAETLVQQVLQEQGFRDCQY